MFYQGDLQSGIATAMREAKPVVCFIRDNQEESTTWEDEYFNSEELRQLLSDSSVTLRLIAGTQEAGFLTSICPIQTFPAVIVIRNGTLQEYLVAGTAKDAFQTRLKTAISTDTAPVELSPPVSSSDTTYNAESQAPSQSAGAIHEPAQAPIVPTPQPQEESVRISPVSQLPTSQPIPANAEALNRESIRAGKRPATRETPEQKKALQEEKERSALQAKLQREQKEQQKERERIRNQIKRDQEARKHSAAVEKNYSDAATSLAGARAKKQPSQYRLQIRLFDGSSVRNSFPPSATIRKDVRPWLESQRSDGAEPYNLKHILTPLPNRTISVAEEERSLEELELGPTASLVMVPVPSYIEAYAPTGVVNSLPGRVVSSGYGLVSGVVGGVAGMVGGLLGYGNTSNQAKTTTSNSDSQQTAPTTPSTTRTRSNGGINIRTIHDQRNERDQNEFYNGNTLNFEPRQGDDSKDK
ncbi:uncharacterized protein BHQ10_008784 [Talaromyces amestolkiae]|uniref:UBX domain-containing protein n=1 Tax=Talaromyces amestolkiae TaxID=1196081 RepID=A0A364LAD1_TALAM|nr:uncharacterized protein BHQ10_008784 [Talaromyces amestolkiae]RAO72772.1 hypothetical protein BHQ10_008784 [Talaromyces amestolkiae]